MTFISSAKLTISALERDAEVSNGTFNNYSKRNADLPAEAIDKISKKWRPKLEDFGFVVLSLQGNAAILNKEEVRALCDQLPPKEKAPEAEQQEPTEGHWRSKYLKEIEDDKAWFKQVFASSLTYILEDVHRISARQKGTGDVVLHSLERLEKKKKGDLVREADKRILQIDTEVRERGTKAAPGN